MTKPTRASGESQGRKVAVIIPARMGSSRFPGKPLAPILGLPMIEHVYRRAALSPLPDAVYVATPDREIAEAVEAFGGRPIMTSAHHQRASDRVAEAVRNLNIDAEVVVNLQGDEPLIRPEMIELAARPLLNDPSIMVSNLAGVITTEEEWRDRNTIKMVMDPDGFALYLSREPIPTDRILGWGNIPVFKQVNVVPFQREFLFTYTELPPTPLEVAESIDMLRVLEHGYKLKLIPCDIDVHAVDTPQDLELVGRLMSQDPLAHRYIDAGRRRQGEA
jgi:3-deoxy-manno-octulosonate cytidylyltransferase (CMP-KDO synthetase)